MDFAGFWIRFFAYLIDLIVLMIVSIPLALIFGDGLVAAATSSSILYNLTSILIGIAYFAGFEASSKQATPGKMALGLIVVDERGQRVSFLRALGRYFAKILSSLILFIGFIIVAFTAKKQGLHDMLASTLVVRGKPGEVGYDVSVFE